MSSRKRSRRWFRFWLAEVLQHWAWLLQDPHDSWMIDYEESDERGTRSYGVVRHCRYRMALVAARELNGRIVGHNATTIPAEGDDGELSV